MASEERDKNGFTPRQALFISEYVRLGERNGTKAAKLAGYSESSAHQRAHELLNNPSIIAGIAKTRREWIQRSATTALYVLNGLLEDNATSASVKKDIALAMLDRAGDKHAEVIELKENRTPEQMRERLAELLQMAQGGRNDAQVIDIEEKAEG